MVIGKPIGGGFPVATYGMTESIAAAVDDQLDAFMHLWAFNRGILMTPFHNMALLSPAHTDADVDRHTRGHCGAHPMKR